MKPEISVLRRMRFAIEYALMMTVVATFSAPPRSIARRLGKLLGSLVHASGIRRNVVLENLATAFPDMTSGDREILAKKCYEHFGSIIVDTFSFHEWSEKQLRERITIEGYEHLKEALKTGRGVVLGTGHLGCYDVGGARLGIDGINLTVVYQGVRNPYVDAYIMRIRQVHGTALAQRGIQFRKVFEVLKNGGCGAILGDQDAGPNGIFIPFFGKVASTLRGPAELALRTGATLIPVFVPVIEGIYTMRFQPPILPGSVKEMMAEYNRRLEAEIRKWPDQYFWLHKRWRTVAPAASSVLPVQ